MAINIKFFNSSKDHNMVLSGYYTLYNSATATEIATQCIDIFSGKIYSSSSAWKQNAETVRVYNKKWLEPAKYINVNNVWRVHLNVRNREKEDEDSYNHDYFWNHCTEIKAFYQRPGTAGGERVVWYMGSRDITEDDWKNNGPWPKPSPPVPPVKPGTSRIRFFNSNKDHNMVLSGYYTLYNSKTVTEIPNKYYDIFSGKIYSSSSAWKQNAETVRVYNKKWLVPEVNITESCIWRVYLNVRNREKTDAQSDGHDYFWNHCTEIKAFYQRPGTAGGERVVWYMGSRDITEDDWKNNGPWPESAPPVKPKAKLGRVPFEGPKLPRPLKK